jgi:hypothetical protein
MISHQEAALARPSSRHVLRKRLTEIVSELDSQDCWIVITGVLRGFGDRS